MIAMADVNKSYLLCLAFIPVAPTGISIYNPGPCFVPLLLSSPILPLFSNLSLYHHSALTVALVFHLFLDVIASQEETHVGRSVGRSRIFKDQLKDHLISQRTIKSAKDHQINSLQSFVSSC